MDDEDDITLGPAARFDGTFVRLVCTVCEDVFDMENDVSNGDWVICDMCGSDLEVTGR